MKPNIGITEKNRDEMSTILEIILSSEMALYVKTRKSHWNISGSSFMEFHVLLEQQYQSTENVIDQVAERIGMLGNNTIGTMEEFIHLTKIKERPGKYPSAFNILKELLIDHETLILFMRKSVTEVTRKSNDIGSVDFITGLIQDHEKTAWILRKYLN